jgi:surface carbohydrate biosynthesis protein (TIGR04326 family)
VIKSLNLVGADSRTVFTEPIIFWDSYEKNPDDLSLPRIVEKNAKEFREKYLELLFELENMHSKRGKFYELFKMSSLNYWDFLYPSEFTFYEKNTANKFLKIAAFIEIAKEQNVEYINVFNVDKEIAKVISSWCGRNGIHFKIVESSKSKVISKVRKKAALQYFLGVGDLLKLYLSNKTLKINRKRRPYLDERSVIFLDYFDNYLPDKASFTSGYWGDLPEIFLKKGFKIHYLHFFAKNSGTKNLLEAKKVMRNFESTSQNTTHELIESYFDFRVMIKSFCIFLNFNILYFRSHRILMECELTADRLILHPVLIDYFRDNLVGRSAAKNALNLALFQRISLEINKKTLVYYLMENQAWEKAANIFLKNAGIKTMGVIHTYRRFWDFRFATLAIQKRRLPEESRFFPDFVLTNSAESTREFSNFGFPKNQILEVEAVRYLDRPLPENSKNRLPRSPLRILVIGEYLRNIAVEQLNFLREAKKSLGESVEFVFRAHPSCDFSVITEYRNYVKVNTGSFNQALVECDEVVAYSSSTAVINVLLAKKRIRIYRYPRLLDGMARLNLKSFLSLQEYLVQINNSLNSSEEESEIPILLNTDPKLPKWRKYISELF